MGSIKVGTKFFISGRRRKIRCVRGSKWNENVRKTRERCRATIDDAPILCKTKASSNILEGLVMKLGGTSSVAGKKGDSIANITASKDIGIHQFTKDLMIGEATFSCKGSMGSRALLGSKEGLHRLLRVGRHRYKVVGNGLGVGIPTVSLQKTGDV